MRIHPEALKYIPIEAQPELMEQYRQSDFLRMVLDVYQEFYPKVGYYPPWIGYLAVHEGNVVGVGGFKSQPVGGIVEIAYGTVPEYEGLGVSTQTCQYLTHLALTQNTELKITARTLMDDSASTSILRKNGYVFVGVVNDPEDGEVWEWLFKKGEG